MPMLRIFVFLFCIIFSTNLQAQKVFVNTFGKLFEINTATNPYTFQEVTGFCSQFAETGVFSIAVYKNILYYNTNSSGRIFGFNLDNPSQCRVVGDFNSMTGGGGNEANSLTVDKDGNIYTALFARGMLMRMNPNTGEVVNLGPMAANGLGIRSGGDLIFYKGALYLAATSGDIFELNLENPSESKLAISSSQFQTTIYGLISVAKDCANNSIFAIQADGRFVELDMDLKRTTGNSFFIPLSVFDGASSVEDGNTLGVNIDSIVIKGPCLDPAANAEVRIVARTSAPGPLSYKLNDNTPQSTGLFPSLNTGTYSLRVSTTANCFKDTTFTIVRGLPAITSLTTVNPLNCDQLNGSVSVVATSGYRPLEYSLNGLPAQATGVFTNLPAGGFTVRVKDAGGCIKDSTIRLVFTTAPTYFNKAEVFPALCGTNTGRINLLVNGQGITVAFNGGQFGPLLQFPNLDAGTYPVSLQKDGACQIDTTIEVKRITDPKPQIEIITKNQLCTGNNGQIALRVSGTGTFTYRLNNGSFQASPVFSGLGPQTHKVTIRNANACEWDTTVAINPYIFAPSIFEKDSLNISCSRPDIGFISLRVTGLQGPYRLLPSTGGGWVTESITVRQLTEGRYGIGVYNADGCRVDSVLFNLVVANPEDCFRFYMPNAFTPNADGLNDVIKPRYASTDRNVLFEVFNRYGQLIFATNLKQVGWDGTFKGKKQNPGSFIWHVRYTDVSGKVITEKGTFVLIR